MSKYHFNLNIAEVNKIIVPLNIANHRVQYVLEIIQPLYLLVLKFSKYAK